MNLDKARFFGMYINCLVIVKDIFISTFTEVGRGYIHLEGRGNLRTNINDCKLILRTFEDMTEEEKTIYSNLTSDTFDFEVQDSAIQTDYLRSIGVEPNFEHYEKLGYCVRSEK